MREIPLTKGYVALVDDADFEWLSQWRWEAVKKRSGVYASRRARAREFDDRTVNRRIAMHREILAAPAGIEVDHVDLNTLNNRRSNLRLCFDGENAFNRAPRRDGTVPFKGVEIGRSGFCARIRRRGLRHHLGTFSDAIAAAVCYDVAATGLFGEYAWLNRDHFPEVAAACAAQQKSEVAA